MSACATLRPWNLPAVAKTSTKNKPLRAVDRLSDVQIDAETGVYVGTLQIGEQRLRAGIRPAPAGSTEPPSSESSWPSFMAALG